MSAFGFADREQFTSDQGIRISRLPLLIVGGLVAAFLVAAVFKFLYYQGWYLIMLVPLFGGLLLAGVMNLLVGWTHCRNQWFAGALGLALGCVAYLGYFYLCFRHDLPPGMNARISWLPRYIAARMANDVVEDVGRPQDINKPKKPSVGLNWYTFVFESLIIMGLAAGAGWTRAKRAYCYELQEWMQREIAQLPPYSGPAIVRAFELVGELAKFVTATPAGGDAQIACRLIVEFAQPTDGSAFSYPIYLSIEDLLNPKPWYWPRTARKTLVRQCVLTPREVVDLRPLFPNLTRLLESQHVELRDHPTAATPAAKLTPSAKLTPAADVAEITPVPEPHRQTIRTGSYAIKVNLIGLLPVIFLLVGVGGLALGGYLVTKSVFGASVVLFAIGGASLAWGIYVALYCMCVYENRWIERRLRSEITTRPDSLVDARDPGSAYVSIIPRDSFVQVKLTMSSDILLMKIDSRQRAIFLEGDSDRYRIPVDAISICEPQCFFHPMDKQRQTEMWMVRLMLRVPHGERELLLGIGHVDFRPCNNVRRRTVATETCQRILAMRTALPNA